MDQPLQADLHRIDLDESLRIQLRNTEVVVIVCDSNGDRIGHYVPIDVPLSIVEALRKCPVSEGELDRRRKLGGGLSLFDYLKSSITPISR